MSAHTTAPVRLTLLQRAQTALRERQRQQRQEDERRHQAEIAAAREQLLGLLSATLELSPDPASIVVLCHGYRIVDGERYDGPEYEPRVTIDEITFSVRHGSHPVLVTIRPCTVCKQGERAGWVGDLADIAEFHAEPVIECPDCFTARREREEAAR